MPGGPYQLAKGEKEKVKEKEEKKYVDSLYALSMFGILEP
jgi:hypothetical protein